MEPIRTFVDVEGDTITVPVPEELRNQRVRVTVEAVTNDADDTGVPIIRHGTRTRKLSELAGSLKGKAGEDLEAHIRQIKGEWDREF
jgi:hypothetical protein